MEEIAIIEEHMRRTFLSIWVVMILGIGAIAQDQCSLPPPVFCNLIPKNQVQGTPACRKDIQQKYIDLLGIATQNLQIFGLDAVKDYSGKDYRRNNRCVEENSKDADEAQKNAEKASLAFEKELHLQEELIRSRNVLNGLAEPLPIENDGIYLSENQQNYQCFVNKEQKYLASFSKLLGRMEIRYTKDKTYVSSVRPCLDEGCQKSINNTQPRENYAQWGTAIQFADRAVITSCHVLESLVDKDYKLTLDPKHEALVVDFGERNDQFEPINEYKVESVIWIPDTKGFDVAVLEIDPYPVSDPHGKPHAVPNVTWGQSVMSAPEEVAVVGYPDFHHPVDPCSDAAFSPYKTQGDAKFVSLGCAFDPSVINSCQNPNDQKDVLLFNTLFHTATTTMGESGSILVEREVSPHDHKPGIPPSIIGVHTCCSYPYDTKELKYSTPPPSKLPCADVDRNEYNQAINVCAVLQNKQLLKALNDRRIKPPQNMKCPITAE